MPQKELERLQAVNRFLNLDIDKDQNLQEIVELASELCETPIALISLFENNMQVYKYRVGTNIKQGVLEDTLCYHLNAGDSILIIENALLDERFINNPHVTGKPFVRFYAGVPLTTHDGHHLGSLCVLDTKPRQINNAQIHLLKILGKRIIQIMEFEFSLKILKEQFLQAKEAEIKLRSFFESGGACHLLLGKDMEVITFNKNMAHFIKRIYHTDLYPGIFVKDILTGQELERFIKECVIALSGKGVEYERKIPYPNEVIWWFMTFDPGYNAEGEIIGISFNAYDITERKLNEQQILAKNHSLKQIAQIQSHELRRPVASILGFMEIFKDNDYKATPDELKMMGIATEELDDKIRDIVNHTQ